MLSKKPSTLQINSESEFNSYFKEVKQIFSETENEHNWKKFADRFEQLSQICKTCHTYGSFLEGARKIRDCLNNSLITERTALSLKAMDFVSNLAKVTQKNFTPYLELVMSSLLKLTGKTNKVFVRKAIAVLNTIIAECKTPNIFPYLIPHFSSKSKQQRVHIFELALNCMNSIPSQELEVHLTTLINAIKAGVVDADSEVRTTSKKMFEKFKKTYPQHQQDLIGVLCDTAKKNLKISGATTSVSSLNRPKPSTLFRSRSDTSPSEVKSNTATTQAKPGVTSTSRPIAQPSMSRLRPTQPATKVVPTVTTRARPIANPVPRLANRSLSGNTRISPNMATKKPPVPIRSTTASTSRNAPSPTRSTIKRPSSFIGTRSDSQTSKHIKSNSSAAIPTKANHTTSTAVSAKPSSYNPFRYDKANEILARSGTGIVRSSTTSSQPALASRKTKVESIRPATPLEKPISNTIEAVPKVTHFASSAPTPSITEYSSKPAEPTPRLSFSTDRETPISYINTISPRMGGGNIPSSPRNKRVLENVSLEDQKHANDSWTEISFNEL